MALAGSPGRAGAEERPYYLHEGERIYLDPAPGHLGVGLLQGAVLPERSALDLPSGRVEATADHLLRSYWSLALAPADRPAAGSAPVAGLRTEALGELRGRSDVEWAYPAYRSPSDGSLVFPTPRIVVRVEPGMEEAAVTDRLPPAVRLVRKLRVGSDIYLLELTNPWTHDPLRVALDLARAGDWIRWAQPDFIARVQLAGLPNDPLIGDQWHALNQGAGDPPGVVGADARLEPAWDFETGDGTVVIAVLDDGVDLAHQDLQGRIFVNPGEIPNNGIDDDDNGYTDDVNGWDFVSGDNDPNPDLIPGCPPSEDPATRCHGTSVAGVAAAAGNNATGVSGACWNCRILPVRMLGVSQFALGHFIGEAISYAGRLDQAEVELVHVLNNSWSFPIEIAPITDAIHDVVENGRDGLGTPVLFAAGNSASGYVFFKLSGIPAGTFTFEWVYAKDGEGSAGLDTAWLDDVVFPDGTVEEFEACSSLPAGWTTTGDVGWLAIDDETRASSARGGNCAVQAGPVEGGESTAIRVTKTLAAGGFLAYRAWIDSECPDSLVLKIYDDQMVLLGTFLEKCGESEAVLDVLAYPASLPETIAVGAATNFDRRSDYSQWGEALDLVAHSSGGSLGITTTDLTGANGEPGDYTPSFGGTSSATPLTAGIVGLLLTQEPDLEEEEVRMRLRAATRKIGPVPYVGGRNDQYGYGVLSAELLLVRFDLDVFRAGSGSGTVGSDPPGIDCGTDCTESYPPGTEVTLTAAPAPGSTFAGWSGACTGGGVCEVTMDEHRAVTATFDLAGGACPSAALECGGSDSRSNDGAGSTDLIDSYACNGFNYAGPEYSYAFQTPIGGEVTVDLTGLGADLDLLVLEELSGGCVQGACVDDSTNTGSADESVTFTAQAGETYYMVVDGFAGAVSGYDISVDCNGSGVIFEDGFESGDLSAWSSVAP